MNLVWAPLNIPSYSESTSGFWELPGPELLIYKPHSLHMNRHYIFLTVSTSRTVINSDRMPILFSPNYIVSAQCDTIGLWAECLYLISHFGLKASVAPSLHSFVTEILKIGNVLQMYNFISNQIVYKHYIFNDVSQYTHAYHKNIILRRLINFCVLSFNFLSLVRATGDQILNIKFNNWPQSSSYS